MPFFQPFIYVVSRTLKHRVPFRSLVRGIAFSLLLYFGGLPAIQRWHGWGHIGGPLFCVASLTCAVKHSMSGCLNSQSACHTLLPFSSLVFCMKSDSRIWPQMGAKRYTNVCNERNDNISILWRISVTTLPARSRPRVQTHPRALFDRKAIRLARGREGDGAKNAAIILVGRGSNGTVAFGNNGRGERE